jgi:hypothetical protein
MGCPSSHFWGSFISGALGGLLSKLELKRPLSRLPLLRPSSSSLIGPVHSHTRPTSPLVVVLTAARTFELYSTFFCTLCHNFCLREDENSCRSTSSRSCVMLIPLSGYAPGSWWLIAAWLARRSKTSLASCFARVSMDRYCVMEYLPYQPERITKTIIPIWRIYRSSDCRRDLRTLQARLSLARDVDANLRPWNVLFPWRGGWLVQNSSEKLHTRPEPRNIAYPSAGTPSAGTAPVVASSVVRPPVDSTTSSRDVISGRDRSKNSENCS